MNTTEKGNKFEDKVLQLLKKDIDTDKTPINPRGHFRIFQKKKYYSEYREGYIEFDIAIEVYQNEENPNYFQLILLECKDYKGSVGVNQISKFLDDVRDLMDGNKSHSIKPIMVISSKLDKGAFNKAKNRNIGLIKINENDELKWIFNRSFKSEGVNQNLDLESIFVDDIQPAYHSSNWFFYTQGKWFSSFQDYLYFITGQKNPNYSVKYLSKGALEDFSKLILKEIAYLGGEVSLDKLLNNSRLDGVKVDRYVTPGKNEDRLLGRVDFEKNEVFIYIKENENEKRDRFTLAHELAHILLEHNRYLSNDAIEEADINTIKPINDSMIAKLEFQANYLASCLLVPKLYLKEIFLKKYIELGLKRRGIFWIYLDDQPTNQLIANNMISKLSYHFNVSKSVIKVRLIEHELLHDRQTPSK